MNARQLASGLGWFSIGLGLAELVLPKTVGRQIGVRRRPATLQALGTREIITGIGLLTSRKPAPWLWARVAGDLMDLALLGAAYPNRRSNERSRLALAATAVLGVTALDVLSGVKASRNGEGQPERQPGQKPRPNHVVRVITINRPPEEVYNFWRDFSNLPRFMEHLVSVSTSSDTRSHWVAKGPAGAQVEWDAEVVHEKAGELIAWRSVDGSQVQNAGTVRFEQAPGGRGTIVRVHMQYDPPGGALGRAAAKLFLQNPEKQMAVDLLRLKQFMETGEIPTTEGQPAGRRSSLSKIDKLIHA
jgi:uncharacterized membrane protein